jgi:hypothetical protein
MILGQSEWLPQLTRINGNAISLICLIIMIYLAFKTKKRKIADPTLRKVCKTSAAEPRYETVKA